VTPFRTTDVAALAERRDFKGLANALKHKETRTEAEQALIALADPAAVPDVVAVSDRLLGSFDAQDAADRVVRSFGAAAAAPLEELLQHGKHEAVVARLLADMGREAGLPALLRAIGSSQPWVRSAAMTGLAAFPGAEGEQALIDALGGSDHSDRKAASDALVNVATQRAVPVLVAAFEDPRTREKAAEALGNLGDRRAAEALRAAGDPEAAKALASVESYVPRKPDLGDSTARCRERVAACLAPLAGSGRWLVETAVARGDGGQIDHVVAGPAGVFVVDDKPTEDVSELSAEGQEAVANLERGGVGYVKAARSVADMVMNDREPGFRSTRRVHAYANEVSAVLGGRPVIPVTVTVDLTGRYGEVDFVNPLQGIWDVPPSRLASFVEGFGDAPAEPDEVRAALAKLGQPRAAEPQPPEPAPAAAPPAGWYPDPWRQAAQRYWDGAAWTAHVA
jgi:HEAT repeat protein